MILAKIFGYYYFYRLRYHSRDLKWRWFREWHFQQDSSTFRGSFSGFQCKWAHFSKYFHLFPLESCWVSFYPWKTNNICSIHVPYMFHICPAWSPYMSPMVVFGTLYVPYIDPCMSPNKPYIAQYMCLKEPYMLAHLCTWTIYVIEYCHSITYMSHLYV